MNCYWQNIDEIEINLVCKNIRWSERSTIVEYFWCSLSSFRLKDEDEDVKKNALIALYNMSGRAILDEVIDREEYCGFLKDEAQTLIDDYENEENGNENE